MSARRKLEKTYGFKLDDYELMSLNKIWIIGCGGNGSHLVSDVARLISTLDKNISIILVDGDIVEEKNLIRQHFTQADIGENKAKVLAGRYSAAYGVDIGYHTEYLTEENAPQILSHISKPQLFITCTDNLKSRQVVATQKGDMWIDLGNEDRSGQVTFSSLKKKPYRSTLFLSGTSFPTPTVFELFPEMEERAKQEVPINQRSCAEMAAEAPEQVGFVNVMCAAIAKNYVHALLTQRPIKTYQAFFTLDNTFEHRTITDAVVKSWVETIPRFDQFYVE